MHLNKKRILSLAKRQGFTQNQLAHDIGVSKSGLSNALSGRRGASPSMIIGLLRIFPKETVFTLTEKAE